MPRITNPDEYQQKRGEILDAAQRLILTKGYERMSIQDILDELSISKGAFYHYFDSKQDLLEAMVLRMMSEAEKFMVPITQDSDLAALEKLERFFSSVARWKSAQRSFLTEILKVWYTDNNAIVRQKLAQAGGRWMAPFMAEIIQQGISEGVMDPGSNGNAAHVVVAMMMSLGESIALDILKLDDDDGSEKRAACLQQIESMVLAYRSGIERVLGAPEGSVTLFDLGILREWVLETGIPSVNLANPAA